MTTYRIIDDSGPTRIVGTIDPDPAQGGARYDWGFSANGDPTDSEGQAAFDPAIGCANKLTTAPCVVTADNDVAGGFAATLNGLAALEPGRIYDLEVRLFVTNQDGTETLSASRTVTGPVDADELALSNDWTGVDPGITGTDLTWDAANATVHSTAGGVFTTSASMNGQPEPS